MEGRDRWFIADLDRDEMLALRTQSLAQLAKEYVRGVENPAWIQAATSLRCGIRNVCPRPARPLSTTRSSIHDAHTHTHTHTHTPAAMRWSSGSRVEVSHKAKASADYPSTSRLYWPRFSLAPRRGAS